MDIFLSGDCRASLIYSFFDLATKILEKYTKRLYSLSNLPRYINPDLEDAGNLGGFVLSRVHKVYESCVVVSGIIDSFVHTPIFFLGG